MFKKKEGTRSSDTLSIHLIIRFYFFTGFMGNERIKAFTA